MRGGTRTDSVLKAVQEKLDHERPGLDVLHQPKAVQLVILFDEHSGEPYRVLYRTESFQDLTPRRKVR